jgi:hypothetical protein
MRHPTYAEAGLDERCFRRSRGCEGRGIYLRTTLRLIRSTGHLVWDAGNNGSKLEQTHSNPG